MAIATATAAGIYAAARQCDGMADIADLKAWFSAFLGIPLKTIGSSLVKDLLAF
jgi:hypothetical protein